MTGVAIWCRSVRICFQTGKNSNSFSVFVCQFVLCWNHWWCWSSLFGYLGWSRVAFKGLQELNFPSTGLSINRGRWWASLPSISQECPMLWLSWPAEERHNISSHEGEFWGRWDLGKVSLGRCQILTSPAPNWHWPGLKSNIPNVP